MTKQEYEAAVKYAMDNDRPPWLDIAIHQAKNNYIASLEAENAKLQADNRSLVEQVNQMAMNQNQEVIEWHKYPEEKPIDGRHLFWDSDGNAPHVLPYNDIVVRDNPGVFSTQTHWAYLPAPPKDEG